MAAPTLLVMAAGMGSRYGGLKQIDPVGPSGEIILDYSAYDAIKAGFDKIVFIIRKDIEEAFREVIGSKLENKMDVSYVFQELSNLPEGFSVPEGRKKPWGTGHAVMTGMDVVKTPFAVINADDFYGPTAYQTMGKYLSTAEDKNGIYDFCMVGYELQNTLSENGDVARGVCTLTSDSHLTDVCERTKIKPFEDGIKFTEDGINWEPLAPETIVSLNLWGFTPSIMNELHDRFSAFLKARQSDILKAEYFLPSVVDTLVKESKATVSVLPTKEKWYGVTYQEDRPLIQAAIRNMVNNGIYPENLWA